MAYGLRMGEEEGIQTTGRRIDPAWEEVYIGYPLLLNRACQNLVA